MAIKPVHLLWVYFFWIGDVAAAPQAEDLILEIQILGVEEIYGWQLDITLPDTAVTYVPGSFLPSGLLPRLRSTVLSTSSSLTIGGQTQDSQAVSGDGVLGRVGFRSRRPTGAVVIFVSGYALFFAEEGEKHRAASREIRFSRETIDGDFDLNGLVDFTDFFLFADSFGGTDPAYDINESGRVDFSDFFLFADVFGFRARLVGRVVLDVREIESLEGVVVIGSISPVGFGVVDVSGSTNPEDTVRVEIVGSISD